MRDYDDYDDDNVRLYTPVFQRVIILAAVIVAVPVVMWTITTFVRSYVARPKVPALERVASTSASVPVAAVAAAPPDPAPLIRSTPSRSDSGATRETAAAPADIKKSGPVLAALSDSPAPSAAANTPSAAPLQADLGQPSSPAITGTAVAGTSDAASDRSSAAAPTASLPRVAAASRTTENVTSSSAPSPTERNADRNIAWPNPNTANPPDFSTSRRSPPPPAPSPARVAAVEALPSDQPIRSQVPLPRHRPGIVAMVGSTMAGSTMAGSGVSTSAVPLPRVRPVGAPVETVSTFSALPPGARPDLESAH